MVFTVPVGTEGKEEGIQKRLQPHGKASHGRQNWMDVMSLL